MKPVKVGRRWKVEVRTATGRGAPRVSRTFDTRTEALRWHAELKAQIQRGAWTAPRDDLTFGAWSQEWLRDLTVSDGTRDSYKAHLKRLSDLDDYRLGQLRRPLLERHLDGLTGSASYRAQTHAVLAIILKSAVADGALLSNPLLGVHPPKVAKREVRVLTSEQLRRLLLAADPRYRTMLHLDVSTGLRQAELFAVRKSRVEFLRRTLAVEEQVITGPGRPPALTGVLKTPASRRRLPLSDSVLDALSAHIAEHPDADLLFTTPRSGKPWSRSHFNEQVWKPTLKAAGLDETLGLHVLRHSYASHLIAAGLHPRVIQARLGHASIVETMDTYGHLFPDSDDATRTALDGLFVLHPDLPAKVGDASGTTGDGPHPL